MLKMKTISIRLEDSIYEELTKNYLTKQEESDMATNVPAAMAMFLTEMFIGRFFMFCGVCRKNSGRGEDLIQIRLRSRRRSSASLRRVG